MKWIHSTYMREIDIAAQAAVRNADRICPKSQASYASSLEDHRRTALFAIGCRRWDCPSCGPVKKAHLIARIVKASPNVMITLTCLHTGAKENRLKGLTSGLRRLIPWIRKESGAIEYFRMTEECADGYPHFHLLARSPFIPQDKLATKWESLTDAPIVDIRKAHGRSTRYVAKYIAKARDQKTNWSRQRCAVSKSFWKAKEPAEQEWIAWEWCRKQVYEEAQNASAIHGLERYRKGTWWLTEREPGDEIPCEIRQMYDKWEEETG